MSAPGSAFASADVGRANARCARALMNGLHGAEGAGVVDVVVAPGSRSTPLALAATEHPGIRVRVVTDERSAGFFAIGLARAGGRPVAVVCTSGTAAANLMPSVAEADLSQVPVLYLTADRPPEARDFGAAQTIRQSGLLAPHARWTFELPVPEPSVALERHFAAVGARAVAVATGVHRGPVQLNAPFREPLLLAEVDAAGLDFDAAALRAPRTQVERGAFGEDAAAEVASALATCERGLIVCGPLPSACGASAVADSILSLASTLSWPLLADPLSGLRYGHGGHERVLDSYDVLLRSERFCDRFRPDAVLRLGALPTSKPLQRYLASLAASGATLHMLVATPGTWPDPDHAADHVVLADAADFAAGVSHALRGSRVSRQPRAQDEWAGAWRDAGRTVRAAVDSELDAELDAEPFLFEGGIARELVGALPADAVCWVGNSMPVRDFDTFTAATTTPLRTGANRGANGIDGVLSTALGAAAASSAPSAVYLGDLSYLHDLSGLQIAARHDIALLVVVASNDGGGIFSFLPQSELGATFEQLFGTPHGLDLKPAAALGHAPHTRVASWTELRERLAAWREHPALEVIEVPTDRERNVRRHREIVAVALSRLEDHLRAAA